MPLTLQFALAVLILLYIVPLPPRLFTVYRGPDLWFKPWPDVYIIGDARIQNVGKYQSCMVSKHRVCICARGSSVLLLLLLLRREFTFLHLRASRAPQQHRHTHHPGRNHQLSIRAHTVGHARIQNVGKYRSCMVGSKLPILRHRP